MLPAVTHHASHTPAARPRRRAAIIAAAVDKSTCLQCDGASPPPPTPPCQVTPTYAANGQHQAHRVQHRGGDRAAVEGVPDAVVATEKAPLIGPHFAQVEGRQGQASCGRRDEREGTGQVREEVAKCRSQTPNQPSRSPPLGLTSRV